MKIDKKLLGFSFITAFFLLLICSKCSPLYPFNDWVDVHCFLTIGRGIKHGMVPYRDLYEQKGPLLYFVVALATMVSEISFIPLFAIEVAAFTAFIYHSMKIVFLWTESKAVYVAAPFVYMAILISTSFSYGFSAEELCLPFLAWTLRIILTRMRANEVLSKKDYFIIGICAAVPFWTKYVFCGYYAGLAVVVALWYVRKGKAREILKAAVWAVSGHLLVTIPILIWYAAKGGLMDLFQAYFINNITGYSDSQDLTGTLMQMLHVMFKENLLCVLCSLPGLVVLAMDMKKNSWEFMAIIAGLFMLVLFILFNRFFWPYYSFILSLFVPLGLIAVGMIVGNRKVLSQSVTVSVISSMALALCTGIAYFRSPNTYLIGVAKDELPQYSFAKIMHDKKENPTLLNYDFLDGGFYYAAGILPVNRFSCLFNVELPEQEAEQEQMIRDGVVDFVVTRDRNTIPGDKYQLIERQGFYSYPGYFDYYLFEKITAE